MKPRLVLLFCISLLLAPVSATAADRTGTDLLLAGFSCKMVQDKLVCGKDLKKNEDGDKPKKTKKEKGDTGLTECTIQGPNSGGGCKTGFKRVCEKLKSGKKCCGCVADPKAEPANAPPAEKPAAQNFCCVGTYAAGFKHTTCGGSEANARGNAEATKFDGAGPTSIVCAPE